MATTIHNRRAAPSTLAGPSTSSIPPRSHDPTSTTPAPMSTEPVVWEAHVTDLIRKDGRWRQVWSLFLKACTIPDDMTTYPGHATQKETRKGKLHREELARCYKDPSAIIDGLAELRQKFLFRHHKWRSSSLPSFLSRAGSNSSTRSISSTSSSTSSGDGSSGSNARECMSVSEWKAHKGRYLRVAPAASVTLLPFPSSSIPSSSPSSSSFIVEDEETQLRELLTTLLSSEMGQGYQREIESSATSTSSSTKNSTKQQQQQQQHQQQHQQEQQQLLLLQQLEQQQQLQLQQQEQSEHLDEMDVLSRGFAYFPPHGYQSWRQNAFDKSSSYRLNLVHNIPTGRSSFRYRHPCTGLLHTLPAIDGTVRLVRTSIPPSCSSSSSSRGWGTGRAAPVWHCMTAEDGHLWCLSYQLSARAGHQVLRGGCLRPVVPLLPLKLSVKIPPPGEGDREGGRRNDGEEEKKKRSTTPLAVSFLFGHRRHPLPGQKQMCQQQQEQGGGGVKVLTPSSGGSSKGGSRRNSRNLTLKRSSRNLDGGGGVEGGRDGGKGGLDESKTGEWDEGGWEGGRDGGGGWFDDGDDLESEMGASISSSCAWVRSGELSSGEEEGVEGEGEGREMMLASIFCDVRLNEVVGG